MANTKNLMTGIVGIIALLVIGIVALAAASDPGDFFYPLKATLTGNGAASIEADLSAMEDIYEQAESLEAQGALTEAERRDLEDAFNRIYADIRVSLGELEQTDPEAAVAARTVIRERLREFGTVLQLDTSINGGVLSSSSSSRRSSVSSFSVSSAFSMRSSLQTSSAQESFTESSPSSTAAPSSAFSAPAASSVAY